MRHLLAAVLVISAVAPRADAQANAIAEQLFNEGRDLAKANRWEEACPKFEASLRQDPALGTRLNLATCFEKIGKLASAWGLYRESADLAKRAGDLKRSAYAEQQAALLEPRLPKLTITAPASAPTGLTVQRDGVALGAAELGLALYVDPGAHEVTASAPGFETFQTSVTIREGETETIAIPALTPKSEAVVTNEVDAPEPSAPASSSSRRTYLALGIGGAGVIAAGVGLVFGAQAMSANSQAEELCGEDLACSATNYDEGRRLIEDGRSKATLSTAFVIAGGAAIAAGAVLYFTAPRPREQTTAQLVPLIHDSAAGVGVAGSF